MEVYDKTKDCVGLCPNCGGRNLSYETSINDGQSLMYPFVCDDCGCKGREAYSVEYSETWFE